MAGDVEWKEPPNGVSPFAGTHVGRSAVARFFADLMAQAQPVEFEPDELIPHGDRVIAIGRYKFLARPTGETWETDWVMIWTVAAGKVKRFQIYKDSAGLRLNQSETNVSRRRST